MEQINSAYEAIIDEFWSCYNENKKEVRNSEESSELQEDTRRMASDMSNLAQRLETQGEKLKNVPNRESLLSAVKAYRKEVQQEKKLQNQLKEHKNLLIQMGSELKNLHGKLNQKTTQRPENLDPLQHIAENLKLNTILADTQLPKEEREVIQELEALERVAREPEPTPNELDNINKQVKYPM